MLNLSRNIIVQIQEIAKNYPIQKIIIFGSRARGDNKPTSDIDIAVFKAPDFNSQGHFTSDIDELNTLLKVDIVFVSKDTEAKLIDNIIKEGITIYERL